MKILVKFSFLLLVLLLIVGPASAPAVAGSSETVLAEESYSVQTFTYEDGHPPEALLESTTAAPYTDFAVHGTMWTPEKRGRFLNFSPKGWGTVTRIKAALAPTNEWVHIPIPLITFLEDIAQKIRYVEFCAQSTNGAVTKPTQIHLWDHNNRFYAGNIAWPANNNINCHGVTFNPGVWKQDLGVSILLSYPNGVDRITLYKAWVQTER